MCGYEICYFVDTNKNKSVVIMTTEAVSSKMLCTGQLCEVLLQQDKGDGGSVPFRTLTSSVTSPFCDMIFVTLFQYASHGVYGTFRTV